MKKIIKRILLILAVIFALLMTVVLIYYSPIFSMNSIETGQIANTNIYAVKNVGNTIYLYQTDNGYIMFDAGSNTKKIENSLNEAGINLNDVKWIFLSHSDGDHVSALSLFPNANIYMNEDEFQLVNGTTKRAFLGGNSLPSGINIDRIIPLSNGQELLFNETKVKCISTPGHTPGSMLYLVDEQYLFSGDVFKIKNGNISVHPYSMDKTISKKTIEQLTEIIKNSQIVLPSHYRICYFVE